MKFIGMVIFSSIALIGCSTSNSQENDENLIELQWENATAEQQQVACSAYSDFVEMGFEDDELIRFVADVNELSPELAEQVIRIMKEDC